MPKNWTHLSGKKSDAAALTGYSYGSEIKLEQIQNSLTELTKICTENKKFVDEMKSQLESKLTTLESKFTEINTKIGKKDS